MGIVFDFFMSIVNFSRNGGWNGKGFDHHPSFESDPKRIYATWNLPENAFKKRDTGAGSIRPTPSQPSGQQAGKSHRDRELEAELKNEGEWPQGN